MKMYLVGGAVRDELMGVAPKDFDFSVVLENTDLITHNTNGEANYFASMQDNLARKHGVTFFPGTAQNPEHFTAKGKFPKHHKYSNLVAEFVLARKEGKYTDGRRPDSVEIGTLHDDLQRRDFSMNAMAQDIETGEFIDPYNGLLAISQRRISAVGSARDKFLEDALRVMRALRFRVQLDFHLDNDIQEAMGWSDVNSALRHKISDNRKMDELNKMFKANAGMTIKMLAERPWLMDAVFDGNINLEATLKQKGFQ